MTSPAFILKDTFGYDTFRPLQREVIENVLAKRDSLAIMPTGGGKSLCYQIPALLLPGLTVVVSPLIALMKDQVEQMRAAGVAAAFLNSTLALADYADTMDAVRYGQIKLLYVAPETLMTPRLFGLLDAVQVDLLTIDEAHCISEWGHDFRPEYRQLVAVRQRYNAVCLALTATATPRVQADIQRSLELPRGNAFVASFNRPNLFIEVAPKSDPLTQTLELLARFKDQSGIIYCFSRKQVDDLTAVLAQAGHSVRPYHAGLEDGVRQRNQEAFIRDDVPIMVATIAFGMGINKPNVRFVIHYDLPKSIEGYYQEIGRAGRDDLPAHCLLLYSYSDVAKQRHFIDQKEGEERQVAVQHLNAMVDYAEGTSVCRRRPLLTYFGETYEAEACQNCDVCTADPGTKTDITVYAQKFLSCVKRTGERFGAGHVVDVLRGSQNEKLLKYKHHELSTYNIGADLTEKQWLHLARQMVQMGYVNQDGEYRTLSLTPKALDALKQRTPILGQLQEAARPTKAARTQEMPDYDAGLFNLLRQKRKALADFAGVPPYVVFSDRTLVEMAAYCPQSPESLLTISGVGQVKARQYGADFLELITAYCRQNDLAEKPKEQPRREKSDAGRRFMAVSEAYNAGATVESLMQQYGVTAGTILEHLNRYISAGHRLRASDDLQALVTLPPAEQHAVAAAFDELGTTYLKPIFDRLEGRVNYDDLKVLRLVYLTTHG